MKKIMVVLAMLAIFVLSLPLVSFALNFSSLGTAKVDGKMGSGEWDKAAKVDFQASLPSSEGGGTTPATMFIMNDESNLYFAVKISRPSYGKLTRFTVEFDNNHDGIAEPGDDVLQMIVGTTTQLTFGDMYRYTCPSDAVGTANCSTLDDDKNRGILPAGTMDGIVSATNDGSYTIFELSHPLSSMDIQHDFSLKPGSKVNFKAALSLTSQSTIVLKGAIGTPAVSLPAETVIPVSENAGGYGQITVASAVIPVAIDIKPGNGSNTMNSKSEGKIPVAIMSNADFKAPESIDTASLKFGRTGEESSLAFCNKGSQDVNGDGMPDLVCHFSMPEAGFYSMDTVGILTGQTTDGQRFMGKDSVRLVR